MARENNLWPSLPLGHDHSLQTPVEASTLTHSIRHDTTQPLQSIGRGSTRRPSADAIDDVRLPANRLASALALTAHRWPPCSRSACLSPSVVRHSDDSRATPGRGPACPGVGVRSHELASPRSDASASGREGGRTDGREWHRCNQSYLVVGQQRPRRARHSGPGIGHRE